MEVSVRELKNHLSEYLRRAAAGEEVVVTSHARPIARLCALPVAAETAAESLARLQEQPWIIPGSGRPPHLPRVLARLEAGEKTLSEMVIEDRG